MSNRTVYAAIILLLIVSSGCDSASPPPSSDSAENHNAAMRAATSVESAAVVTYVSGYFASAATLAMRQTPAAEAPAQVLAAVKARVSADLVNPACVTVDTNNLTYIMITFGGCSGAHGKLGLSGTVRAEVGFETATCGQARCPVAVLYDMTTLDLQLGNAMIIGNWQIRDPLAIDQPYTWAGLLDVVTPERGVTFTTAASFTRAGDCVDVTLDSTLGGSGQKSLTCSAEGLSRCMGACPNVGTVNLTTEAGAIMSWSYDGTSGADVSSESGDTFPISLTCGSS